MDYAYFSQPQSYQFTAFPPTPAHSYEPHDDQSNEAPGKYEDLYPANGFQNFDPNFHFTAATSSFIPAQHPQPQPSPPQQSEPQVIPLDSIEEQGVNVQNGEQASTEGNGHRSSSEDKETLTPAQSRRKAQNRAAQRAFRERKERHVKDLESKLHSLSAHSSTLLTDNERLKRELQRLATQNEILRATASQPTPVARAPSPIHGPQTYSPTDFQAAVGEANHPLSFEDFGGPEGNRLLAVGATWDYIINHESYQKGHVDVADVHRRLKGRAACDGRGPAFKESEVLRAIEESVICGNDELI